MTTSSPRAFGKRTAAHATSAGSAATPATAQDQAAFFERVRAEVADRGEQRACHVPHSFKSASLAGLVVGCGLAGFNVTDTSAGNRFSALTEHLGLQADMSNLMPAMILLGLLSGVRAAALTLLLLRWLLDRAGHTDHLSYLVGGALISVCVAGAVLAILGHPPAHGWVVEGLSGAAAGLMYRGFAGTRAARPG